MNTSLTTLLAWLALAACLDPRPVGAQRRALTIDDYLALPAVGDPQLSPDGKWVAYTVTRSSLKENRAATRIWLADVAGGQARQLTAGPGSDRQPRWSPDGRTLAFVSTRESGAQLWLLPLAGGEARRVTSVADGVSDPIWLADGSGVLVTSDLKWPPEQELDRRNGEFSTEARVWTNLLWRRWDEWRPGRRQHLFLVRARGWQRPRPHPGRSRRAHDRHGWRRRRGRVSRGERDRGGDARRLNSRRQHQLQVLPGGVGVVYLHQSNTQPAELWTGGRQLTHLTEAALAGLDLKPLEEYGFVGALGDSVHGWILRPPGFDPARKYPLIYLVHGGPQGAWDDNWHARWNYQMFAARGYVVAAVNFHAPRATGSGSPMRFPSLGATTPTPT